MKKQNVKEKYTFNANKLSPIGQFINDRLFELFEHVIMLTSLIKAIIVVLYAYCMHLQTSNLMWIFIG